MFLTASLILGVVGINTMMVATAPTPDVAVVSVTPLLDLVRLGELVNITVVVENQGTELATFNVTVYYDSNDIETKILSDLPAGGNQSLSFTWNTSMVTSIVDVPYKINATASTLPGETDTEDNTLVSPVRVRIYQSPYIGVVPHSIVDATLKQDATFTISIWTDYNGSDISHWKFTLTYNPSVLNGVNVTNGDLTTTAKHPSAIFLAGTFDNTGGKLSSTEGFFVGLPPPTTSGPGTLANVTFKVVGVAESIITVGLETQLLGWDSEANKEYIVISRDKPALHHILHGYFRNSVAGILHDVAVVNVASSPTLVEAGELVNITVVVENQGTVAETFDVEVYYDYNPQELGVRRLKTETISGLEPDANHSLAFAWDTIKVVAGNHTITAIASVVFDETETDDNVRRGDQPIIVKEPFEPPIPITLIIGVLVTVTVVITAVRYILKRRKKPLAEEDLF